MQEDGRGRGSLQTGQRVNGRPLEMIKARTLQYKLLETILLLDKERFGGVDIRVRVKGGGHVAHPSVSPSPKRWWPITRICG